MMIDYMIADDITDELVKNVIHKQP